MSAPLLISSFTPSTMRPEVLEAIFVKRDPLAERIVDSLVAAVRDGDIEHHLAVGPRGMGKTHLLTIVVNRLRGRDLGDALAVAWLREDEWGVTNLGELYEQMLIQLAEDPTADITLRDAATTAAEELLSVDPDVLAHTAEGHLTELLTGRRLVVVVENLDQIFSSIGEEDQHQLRAYLQTHRNVVLLSSSPSLSPSIATRQGLFFGFFAIHHLEELTVDEARDLLLRIAELRGDEEGTRLRDYLTTSEATNRLKVVARIAGGHPRLWVLMSECITTERLDEIVTLLHALLDDLTPYYQAQMTSLSGQQRKVVNDLARTEGALVVKDIADHTRLTHNAAAKHIGDLVKLGFVRPALLPEGTALADRRKKAYELREPLLRHCLALKMARGQPLEVIVLFLRTWYELPQLQLWANSPHELVASYASAALHTIADDDMVKAFREALSLAQGGRVEEALTTLDSFSTTSSPSTFSLMRACVLFMGGRHLEVIEEVDAMTSSGADPLVREMRAASLLALGRHEDVIEGVAGLETLNALRLTGVAHFALGRFDSALRSFDRGLALSPRTDQHNPEVAGFHDLRARTLTALGDHDEAREAAEAAAQENPELREYEVGLALASMRAIGRLPDPSSLEPLMVATEGDEGETDWLVGCLAIAIDDLSDDQALAVLTDLFELPGLDEWWMASIGAHALGAVGTEAFMSRPPEMQLRWLDITASHLEGVGASAQFGHWARALRTYIVHGDVESLLVLPAEVRDLFPTATKVAD